MTDTTRPRFPRPALRLRQDRPDRLRPRARRARRRARLDRRHRAGACGGRPGGDATSPTSPAFPEMMDGRVKTLHPKVHGGLLAMREQPGACGGDAGARHRADRPAGRQPLSVRGDGRQGRRLRGLHREHRHRRPGDDPRRGQEPRRRRRGGRPGRLRRPCSTSSPRNDGATTLTLRRKLAAKAFARTAAYDAAISNWFAAQLGDRRRRISAPSAGNWSQALRYGENPHQTAAFYAHAADSGRASPPRGSCRARSSPTTTSTTPTPPMSASASSMPRAPRPASSSSTPTPAASPRATICVERLPQGAGLRLRRRPSAASSR